MKPKKCPECGSENDAFLPLVRGDEDYEKAGARWYCVICGWISKKGTNMKMTVEPRISIQNVVASASFKHGIDLKSIVKAFPHVDYRPEVFPGLVFRVTKPKTAILIFQTGRMVCTGAKSERAARRAIHKVAKELSGAGIIINGRPEITIQNIVASVNLGNVVVDLEDFIYAAQDCGKKVMYEPEQFPGAIYRMEDPKVVFLIFNSGKLVCVGAKRETDIQRAVGKLTTMLDENGLVFPINSGRGVV